MIELPFNKEIDSPKLNDNLADIIPQVNQERFCNDLKGQYKSFDGDIFCCFEWGYRIFKAVRSILFSGRLLLESEIGIENGNHEAFIFYGLYYSFFHASYALLNLHPNIKFEELRHISHKRLSNYIDVFFIKHKVLPYLFIESLEDLRVLRELTSYFAPLSGIKKSAQPDMISYLDKYERFKKQISYAFQLSNVMGEILWKVKCDCESNNLKDCEANYKKYKVELGDLMEKWINYPEFQYKHGFPTENLFDQTDVELAVKKFGLYHMCPVKPLQYMALEHCLEDLEFKDEVVNKRFDKLMTKLW